ncbi:RNase adapter RapZ [Methylotenera sp.]|uniref:RNase adapter RapZ n=1 Tax=Methylotenera sp. TaxID=2051956 RepID=UPI002731BC03|nr:RNase adapter RapZ [Methylotenera sp.]MDP2231895.1 RNase adapter RapZ [Methylotenera sp.]MDP3140994.1 RNase adapter RapZ [Methylotenera sp.]
MKQLIIVTGLSGSGKSIALHALEDSGYYCIDNLPATMLPQIAEHLQSETRRAENPNVANYDRVAISIDSRSAAIETLPAHIEQLKLQGVTTQVLFLESNAETLVKRFSETRRKHPLSKDTTTLAESIAVERELLGNLGNLGHVIDTSHISANKLRAWIKEAVSIDHTGLTLLFTSFGFKHGIPLDADFVFDIRCLPNPHYDPKLRDLTGRDAEVQLFLEKQPNAQEMLNDIKQYIEKWLPCFVTDNRSYLTVAIGCTGGQHRSVYFVEQLSQHFKSTQKVLSRHRELT